MNTTQQAADACLYVAAGLLAVWLVYLVVTGIAYAMQVMAEIRGRDRDS